MRGEVLPTAQIASLAQALTEVRPALMRFGHRFFQQHCDVDDLVQSTMLLAWTNLDSFTPGRSMKSWTYAILYNVFIDDYRKRRGQPAIDPEFLIEQISTQPTQDWTIRKNEVLLAIERMAPECGSEDLPCW